MIPDEPNHIIAIGASAGGLEEINSFFDHTPLDGVSYVIVQHLSADYKSRMVELLARHSKLVVLEAGNGMTVQKNQVYLIPNDKFMTIRKGKLYLTEKAKGQNAHLTINTFFNSLAADRGKKAIGVILSGLGSDGTEGVKAIKKSGGMIIARNPETSAFGSMPSHTIATGLVDFVLEPEAMPSAIEDYIKYGEEPTDNINDDEGNIKAIIELIREKSPMDFTDYKLATIFRRTKRRAAYNNFNTLGSYLEFLKANPDEIEALAKEFLISVTSFFRDKEAFDSIQKNILPSIIEKLAPGEELKMWVAGCATGEEVYSLAILAAEQLKESRKDIIVKIFATDIDTVALVHAGKGVYPAGIEKNISPDRLEKHFLKEGNNYRIKPDIRKMVIFAQHDLVKNPPYCNMHFISCRNLLIYMTPALQKKVFALLLFGLKMDGYLFLGSSENPGPIIKSLEVINKKWKIYRNLETRRKVSFDAFSFPELADIKRSASSSAQAESLKNANNIVAEAMHESMARDLDQLVVCVNENNEVIKSYGDTKKYLLPQHFNSNLAELLPKPLAVAFSTLSINALKSNKKSTIDRIKIKQGDLILEVNLSVSPLTIKKGERMLMAIFTENKLSTQKEADLSVFDEKIYHDQYTLNLEEQVKDLKDKLQSTIEQLDASNENMQSFNEELLSANEEMQSTNEEMQSVNEELDTINAEYQLKNKELVEINDDLNNYFRSNINGQLFINNELLLMRFSPGAVKLINLQDSDIGRPLSNISTNIKMESMIKDIHEVLEKGNIITKEIETKDGKWYQIMTMPYVQQTENKNNGAVITFNDITELKKAQQELDHKNTGLLRINADLDNFVHTASHDLLGPLNNIEQSITVMNLIDVSDPELNHFLKIIDASIKKFRELVNEISSVAKLENDMIELEMIDLEEIIHNIEWSLEDKIKLTGTVLTKNLEVKHIYFSKKNLRSIFYNLISNAIKFKGDMPPAIKIRTQKQGNHIILTVQDNGLGIPKSGIDQIFKKYGRLKPDIEGQGIGLFLARKIIDAAGGNITVESDPGKGSKFIIHFVDEPGYSLAATSLN